MLNKQISQLELYGSMQNESIEKYLSYESIVQIDRRILTDLVDQIVVDKVLAERVGFFTPRGKPRGDPANPLRHTAQEFNSIHPFQQKFRAPLRMP